MNELRAAAVDLSALKKVIGSEIVDSLTAKPSPELAAANSFEEGQISGPFGPQFVGYGAEPKLPLIDRLRPALFGLACGAVAFGANIALGRL